MKTAVLGASGYAGGELLRLLQRHPRFVLSAISAQSNRGELVTSLHPQLQSYAGKVFGSIDEIDFAQVDAVFLALPHGESAAIVNRIPAHVRVIDLGADFRLANGTLWQKYYGGTHAGTWVYGLPELPGQRAKISQERRVANPGCYATSILLGIAPAIEFIELNDVVVVGASGTSGAGRSSNINLSASETMGSLTSYKFGGLHQHTPEIEEAISNLSGVEAKISFTPILAPMPRGILATITAKLTSPMSSGQAHARFTCAYKDERFVTVLPIGVMPKTSSLLGSNSVQMQVAVDEHTNRLVVSVAIDNLGKGAAGQAIQNANIMFGLLESDGLESSGLGA